MAFTGWMISTLFSLERWHLKANFRFWISGSKSKYSTATRPSIELMTKPSLFGKMRMHRVWYLSEDSRRVTNCSILRRSQIRTLRSDVATTNFSSMQFIEYTFPLFCSYVPTHSFSLVSHNFTVLSQLPVKIPFTLVAISTHFMASLCVPIVVSVCVFKS